MAHLRCWCCTVPRLWGLLLLSEATSLLRIARDSIVEKEVGLGRIFAREWGAGERFAIESYETFRGLVVRTTTLWKFWPGA